MTAGELVEGLPKGARLENYANNVSRPQNTGFFAADLRRQSRYERRAAQWRLSSLPRCRKCGRTPVTESGLVAVRHRAGVAGFAGLSTCASVWACPVCNAKIMARRAVEIGGAVGLAHQAGMVVVLVTFTLRHDRAQSLRVLWDSVSHCWRRVITGRHWSKSAREAAGVLGFVRVSEVTYGDRNGWHPHTHTLLFLEPGTTARRVDALCFSMWSRWSAGARAMGLDDPLIDGQDWHTIEGPGDIELGRYLSKSVDQGVGVELTSTQTKGARTDFGTVPWWELLTRVIEDGDAEAAALWSEWETTSKGRKQMTWANGTREMLGLLREQSDEEIATEELGSTADDLAYITPDGWRSLVARPALIPQVLAATERAGLVGLREFLEAHCVEYVTA